MVSQLGPWQMIQDLRTRNMVSHDSDISEAAVRNYVDDDRQKQTDESANYCTEASCLTLL